MKELSKNEALMLYFLSLRPALALSDLNKMVSSFSDHGKRVYQWFQDSNSKRGNFKIPICEDPAEYTRKVEIIDRILAVDPLLHGGEEAVLGYLKYCGVLTQAGKLRKVTTNKGGKE